MSFFVLGRGQGRSFLGHSALAIESACTTEGADGAAVLYQCGDRCAPDASLGAYGAPGLFLSIIPPKLVATSPGEFYYGVLSSDEPTPRESGWDEILAVKGRFRARFAGRPPHSNLHYPAPPVRYNNDDWWEGLGADYAVLLVRDAVEIRLGDTTCGEEKAAIDYLNRINRRPGRFGPYNYVTNNCTTPIAKALRVALGTNAFGKPPPYPGGSGFRAPVVVPSKYAGMLVKYGGGREDFQVIRHPMLASRDIKPSLDPRGWWWSPCPCLIYPAANLKKDDREFSVPKANNLHLRLSLLKKAASEPWVDGGPTVAANAFLDAAGESSAVPERGPTLRDDIREIRVEILQAWVRSGKTSEDMARTARSLLKHRRTVSLGDLTLTRIGPDIEIRDAADPSAPLRLDKKGRLKQLPSAP